MRAVSVAIFSAVALCGCTRRDEASVVRGPVAAPSAACPSSSEPRVVGAVHDRELVELSGLAASLRHAGVAWTHNDSGDRARVFAIDAQGDVRATIALEGVDATDFEDLAVAPCGASSCVFVADIGDNRVARAEVAVHRFVEPASLENGSVAVETLRFRYADGPHNAEALLADPRDGSLFVVTKEKSGPSGVYRVPAGGGVAVREGSLTPPLGSNLVTAGSVAPTGALVALRTYTHAFVYPVAAGEALPRALERPPCVVKAPPEPQGEAIAFVDAGRALRFVGEGSEPPLYEVTLAPASP